MKKKKSEIHAEEIIGSASGEELFERLEKLRRTRENLYALSAARSSLEDGFVKKCLDAWFFRKTVRKESTIYGNIDIARPDMEKVLAWFAHNTCPEAEFFNIRDAEHVLDSLTRQREEMPESDVDAAVAVIDYVCGPHSHEGADGERASFLTGLVESAFVVFDVRIAEKVARKLETLPATKANIRHLERVESLDALYDTSPEATLLLGDAYREKMVEVASTLDAAEFLSLPTTGTNEPTERRLAFELLKKSPGTEVLLPFAERFDMPNDARLELVRRANETGTPERSYENARAVYSAAGEIFFLARARGAELHLPVIMETCRVLISFEDGTELFFESGTEEKTRELEQMLDVLARSFIESVAEAGKMTRDDLLVLFDFLDVFESHFDKSIVGCSPSDAEMFSRGAAKLVSEAAEMISAGDDEILQKCMLFVGAKWFGYIEPSGGAEFAGAMGRLAAAVAGRAGEEGVPAL